MIFFQKILKALFHIELNFHNDQRLKRLYDKALKLPYEICNIFLVDLGFSFYFI
jgi:hypothetical protein